MMVPVFGFREGSGTISQHFTCLPKATGFSNVSDNSMFDTNGYRVIGGLGTNDPDSLFRGEVYGGYQAQNQNSCWLCCPQWLLWASPRRKQPCLWWPSFLFPDPILDAYSVRSTRFWEFRRCCHPPFRRGLLPRTITAILQTTYGTLAAWSVGVRGGYTRAEFIGVPQAR